ncbi:MAG TPA: hypothetical protein VNX69_00745 [Steroidobacteraceae bacterium]|jgi:hypothetical protein|nr:hypothetical protein [Steroidobacteraceae bacterium]
MADILTSPHSTQAATTTQTDDRSNQAQASQIRTEYWAKRIVWFLIALTSLWDIAVTIDKDFALTRRFF